MCGTCGTSSCSGCGSFEIPEGAAGLNGWSPQFAVVADGATREVLQLVAWVGGTGTTPGHIGEYISNTGYTTVIGDAENIKGSASFVFTDVSASPDQTITYTNGTTVVPVTSTTITPAAGIYNVTFTGIYYGQEATATGKFGIYKNTTLQNIALQVGPTNPASSKYNITLMASNLSMNGSDTFSVGCVETTVATHINLFSFIMTYQKIG